MSDSTKLDLEKRVLQHLNRIYADVLDKKNIKQLSNSLLEHVIETQNDMPLHITEDGESWSQNTIVMITYADTIEDKNSLPINSINKFLKEYCADTFEIVHILPFFPSSSDKGFSVKDYYSVYHQFGQWNDILRISKEFGVMADVVINHGSSESLWFKNFIKGEGKGSDYFLNFDEPFDTSKVVRPRTSDLLNPVETADGTKYIWCTFSKDQVDYNFSNPVVLFEFIQIIIFYLSRGITVFRFDAVAFIWKKIGTSCINLEKTHEIVRLFRTLLTYLSPKAILVTETNTPARENVSYFGNANEAHWIYNFSLPPILIYSILAGDSSYLEKLTMSMPPPQLGTSYLNFIASHDGIGLRPAETFLTKDEISRFINLMEQNGGRVSYRSNNTDTPEPYEINITLFDAMKESFNKEVNLYLERFICIHAIMLSLEGVPAFYIHSLFGTQNDYALYKQNNQNRSLNRGKIKISEIDLSNESESQSHIFLQLKKLMLIRKKQPAFHPNAVQFTLHLGSNLYGIWRQSLDKKQSIFCISNLTDEIVKLSLLDLNLIGFDHWRDIITEIEIDDITSEIEFSPYQTMWLTNLQD
jgi:sucrose phosphorylase